MKASPAFTRTRCRPMQAARVRSQRSALKASSGWILLMFMPVCPVAIPIFLELEPEPRRVRKVRPSPSSPMPPSNSTSSSQTQSSQSQVEDNPLASVENLASDYGPSQTRPETSPPPAQSTTIPPIPPEAVLDLQQEQLQYAHSPPLETLGDRPPRGNQDGNPSLSDSSRGRPKLSLENMFRTIPRLPAVAFLWSLPSPGERDDMPPFTAGPWWNNLNSRSISRYLLATRLVLTAGAMITSDPVHRAWYFWRRAGPIVAHYKWTHWWLHVTRANAEKRHCVFQALHDRYCAPLYEIAIHLKGLYVKMCQIMSSRPDFMPPQYVELFQQAQDAMPQWPIETVQQIIDQELWQYHGLHFDQVFEWMDPIALGSASIGQVHQAILTDEWVHRFLAHRKQLQQPSARVAVKVMHPEAKQRFANDFQVFRWLCRVALPDWLTFLDEVERRIMSEFDYRHEAVNMKQIRTNMAQSPYATKVRVPQPIMELCSQKVLVMELFHGQKLMDVIQDQLSTALGGNDRVAAEFITKRTNEVLQGTKNYEASAMVLADLAILDKVKLLQLLNKCRDIVHLLVDVHGHQILINGCYNGDPHFGNCMYLDDGRIGLIDFGQTRLMNNEERLAIAKIVYALGSGGDPATVADAMRQAGFVVKDQADDESLYKYANLFFDSDLASSHKGFATPQLYFASLMASNPLLVIPDSSVRCLSLARACFFVAWAK